MNLYSFLTHLSNENVRVLPLREKGKGAILSSWQTNASSKLDDIETWFKNKPLNAGILCGKKNGIIVVDIDPKNGGFESLEKLESEIRAFKNSSNYVVRTGSGGLHLFYAYPYEKNIKGRINFLPGVDIKSDNGYVVSPYSIHPNGKMYEPINNGGSEFCVKNLNPLPHELMDLLINKVVSPYRHISEEKFVEGSRNENLFKRLCSIRNEPSSWNQFLEKAISENLKLCSPPLSEVEVENIAKSVFSRYSSIKLSEPEISTEAFYGPIGDLVLKIKDETEACKEAMLFQALMIVGNLIDKKAFLAINGSRIYTNIFVLVIGKTSKARKGTSFKAVSLFFKKTWGALYTDRLMRGISTGEGIVWRMRDPQVEEYTDKHGNVKEKVIDQGQKYQQAIFREEEFTKILKNGKRENNNLTEVIRECYDVEVLQSISKSNPAKSSNAFISIVGHSTKEEFLRTINEVDKDNGMLNRFLFCHSYRANIIPQPVDFEILDQQMNLCQELNEVKSFIDSLSEAKMFFSPEGTVWWEKFYREYGNAEEESNENLKGRTETHLLKLAMIFALCDNTMEIDECHLIAAEAVLSYSNQSIDYIFNNNTNTLEDRFLDFLRRNNNQVTRTDVSYKFFKRKKSSDSIEEVKKRLLEKKLISVEKIDNTEYWKGISPAML